MNLRIVKETNGMGEIRYYVEKIRVNSFGVDMVDTLHTTSSLQKAKDFIDRQKIERKVVYET